MRITFEGLSEKLNVVHVTDGRKTYFYDNETNESMWCLPPEEVEKLVSNCVLACEVV